MADHRDSTLRGRRVEGPALTIRGARTGSGWRSVPLAAVAVFISGKRLLLFPLLLDLVRARQARPKLLLASAGCFAFVAAAYFHGYVLPVKWRRGKRFCFCCAGFYAYVGLFMGSLTGEN